MLRLLTAYIALITFYLVVQSPVIISNNHNANKEVSNTYFIAENSAIPPSNTQLKEKISAKDLLNILWISFSYFTIIKNKHTVPVSSFVYSSLDYRLYPSGPSPPFTKA